MLIVFEKLREIWPIDLWYFNALRHCYAQNNCRWLRSQMPLSSRPRWWLSAILVTANTWRAAWCIVVMLCPRMLTPPWPPSKPSAPFSSSTGAQPDSSVASTISPRLWCLVVIWLKCSAPCAWFQTLPPSPKCSRVSITSLIWYAFFL